MDPLQLFEHCITRERLTVPQEWYAGTAHCVAELRHAVALVSACRFDQTEPSNGFFPQAVVNHYEATYDQHAAPSAVS